MNSEACDHHPSADHFKQPRHWSRLLYMLLFALFLNVAGAVMWLLAALQFGFVLTTGRDNDRLREFGGSVAAFFEQALLFVSYNSEHKPFPFAAWPGCVQPGCVQSGCAQPDSDRPGSDKPDETHAAGEPRPGHADDAPPQPPQAQ